MEEQLTLNQWVSGTITWGPGDGATKTFTIALVNDGITEGNETVNLTLSNPTGGAVIDGDRGTAVLTILETGGVPPGGNNNRPGTISEPSQVPISCRVSSDFAFPVLMYLRLRSE